MTTLAKQLEHSLLRVLIINFNSLYLEVKHMRNCISLRKLKIGQSAVVCAVQAGGEMGRRIRDMGLVPGAELKVIGRAPLQDPVAIRLQGFTLSLRNNEADYIQVETI